MFSGNRTPKELVSTKKLDKIQMKNILKGRTLLAATVVFSQDGRSPRVKYVMDKPVPHYYPYKFFLPRTMMKNPKWSDRDLVKSELAVLQPNKC